MDRRSSSCVTIDSCPRATLSPCLALSTTPDTSAAKIRTTRHIPGQVRSLLDKRVGAAVSVALVAGALRAVNCLSISSRIAFN